MKEGLLDLWPLCRACAYGDCETGECDKKLEPAMQCDEYESKY